MMNAKIYKFLIVLFSLTVVVWLLGWLIQTLFTGTTAAMVGRPIFFALYIFTPLCSVLIVEKKAIKVLFSEYKLTFCQINLRSLLTYIIGTIILFPAIMLLCVWVMNLCGIDIIQTYNPKAVMSDSVFADYAILSLKTLGIVMLTGLIFSLPAAFAGEVAWRGYLEHNVQQSYFSKYLFIGAIWGVWSIPALLFPSISGCTDMVLAIALKIVLCIVSSFFLAGALKKAKTLYVTIALYGIIGMQTSCISQFIIPDCSVMPWQYIAITTTSVIILMCVFSLFNRRD